MSNNIFGDTTGLCHFVLAVPVSSGNVCLYRDCKGEREFLTEIPRPSWKVIKRAVELEFNLRSKEDGYRVAHFGIGENQLCGQYGRELAVLMWAVEEEAVEETIATARRNWQTMQPEERWWWFRQAYASNSALQSKGMTPAEAHSRGWCGAVHEGLCTVYTR